MTVKPDLVGYAFNTLDAEMQAGVMAYLRDHPESQSEVDSVRRAMMHLAADAKLDPPPGLADRTLARLAAEQARPKPKTVTGFRGFRWRRILEVAAAVLVVVTAAGVGISWLGRLRTQQPGGDPTVVQVVACKDNLHRLFGALRAYGEMHNGKFPQAIKDGEVPANVTGLVFSALQEKGLLPSDFEVACPATQAAGSGGVLVNYAYSLGYSQDGQVTGPRMESGKALSMMPLMADSSPLDPRQVGQSLNHGGSGQNVLYSDGHVVFCPSRFAGIKNDDIYLNRDNKVAPGVDWSDVVLTSGTGRD